MAAAFATILISHESSAIGSVTRQVPTPDHMFNMLATDLCTAVPTTVRRGLTTGSAPTKVLDGARDDDRECNHGQAEPFDLYSPLIDADPFPYYTELREKYPCYWSDDAQLWILSRYDDIINALRDWQTFSSAGGNMI